MQHEPVPRVNATVFIKYFAAAATSHSDQRARKRNVSAFCLVSWYCWSLHSVHWKGFRRVNRSKVNFRFYNTIRHYSINCSKDGKEIVTPGIAGLAFVLLKSPTPSLHAIANHMLGQFVKKRFIFGPGIIKHITDFMLADQESQQYDGNWTLIRNYEYILMTVRSITQSA